MLDTKTAWKERNPIHGRQPANKSTVTYDHSNGRRCKWILAFRRFTLRNIDRREGLVDHLHFRAFFGD